MSHERTDKDLVESLNCTKGSEFNVDTHNFEKAKDRIKKLSEDIPEKEKFDTFVTKDSFILKCFERDHHVTGEELNEFVKNTAFSFEALFLEP